VLHLLSFVVLVIFAIGCAAYIWLDQAYGSPKPSERGITLMLFAWLFAGMVKPEIPAIVWSWWSQELPETGTTLHLVTTGLLTLLSWLAMMLGVIGVGASISYGWLHWRRNPRQVM